MAQPLITVLMPNYNGIRHLSSAIESILKQDYTNFEFIIIDDGSTDGSTHRLNQYAKADSRIRFIQQPHNGLVKTLNLGLKLANGELIARMDSDDFSEPNRLSEQVKFLMTHPHVGLVGSWASRIYGNGLKPNLSNWETPIDHAPIIKAQTSGRGPQIIHPCVMMRKSIVTKLGGYAEWATTAEDYELWCRMGKVTTLSNIAKPLVRYRIHPSSVSLSKQLKQKEISYHIARKHYHTDWPKTYNPPLKNSDNTELYIMLIDAAIHSRRTLTALRILIDSVKHGKCQHTVLFEYLRRALDRLPLKLKNTTRRS